MPKTPEICPVCGHDIPKGKLACPECGADEYSGWNEEDLVYDGIDLPDEGYGSDPLEEIESGKPRKQNWLGISVAVLLLIVFVAYIF